MQLGVRRSLGIVRGSYRDHRALDQAGHFFLFPFPRRISATTVLDVGLPAAGTMLTPGTRPRAEIVCRSCILNNGDGLMMVVSGVHVVFFFNGHYPTGAHISVSRCWLGGMTW